MLFLTTALAAELVQLRSPFATATSFLKSNWNQNNENYHPNYVLDGNPETAWVEGESGDGIGERITLPLSAVNGVSRIELKIRSGYQKSDKLWEANNAPDLISIRLWYKGKEVAYHNVELKQENGWQTLSFSENSVSMDAISLEILSVYAGKTYRDTCISDIEVWAETTTPYNAEAESARYNTLKTWVSERAQQAAYFAALPPQYPIAGTRLDESERTDLTQAQFEALVAPIRELAKTVSKTASRYSPAFQTHFKNPDGWSWEVPSLIDWMQTSNISFFETTKNTVLTFASQTAWDEHADWFGAMRVEWADEKTPRHVWFTTKWVSGEREVITYTGERL
jgi:hypothetical protein